MKYIEYLGLSLLWLMIVFGQVDSFIYVKIVLLLIVCGCIMINLFATQRFPVDYRIIATTLIMCTCGLIFLFAGVLNNNPGAIAMSRIHVLWPLLYLVLVAGACNIITLKTISNTIIFSSFIVGSYGIIIILVRLGHLPPIFDISDYLVLSTTNIGLDVSIAEGFIKMNTLGINIVPYLLPYVLSYFILSYNSENKICKTNIWLIVVMVSLVVIAIISLRKAILVVAILSVIITIIFNRFRKYNYALRLNIKDILIFVSIASFTMLSINYLYDYNINMIVDNLISGFDFSSKSDDMGAYSRLMQFHALRDGWLDHPWFGAGLGASAYAYGWVSSPETPWAYELSYMALLYQVGLVGITIYFLGIFWIFCYGLKIIKEDSDLVFIMIPSLTALLCFLLANATNPYLTKFEALWTIFYPIAIINYWLYRDRLVPRGCN
jgi:hypothetical protein